MYRFFGSLINGQDEPVPLSATNAYQVNRASTRHFASDICEIAMNTGKVNLPPCYDLKDFGISKPKILTDILTLSCEFTLKFKT
ncbi:hypothetical protein [Kingella kingae]|uniref:hypothetical protein n=1 Tax=Kingella kingae TaxID=504 RepID=UPI00069328AE|nr:hypothetical protein [Kingella kingae]